MKRTQIAAALTVLLGVCSAAFADSPLAAPGDCAQPSRDFDTGPVIPAVSSAGVAGPPTTHFAPIAILGSVGALLPADLTRTAAQTVDAIAAPLPIDPGSVPLLSDPGSLQVLSNPTSSPVLQPVVTTLDGVLK